VPAKGILVGEIVLGERLIDYHGLGGRIAIGELATGP
jgi:hypothetical protein